MCSKLKPVYPSLCILREMKIAGSLRSTTSACLFCCELWCKRTYMHSQLELARLFEQKHTSAWFSGHCSFQVLATSWSRRMSTKVPSSFQRLIYRLCCCALTYRLHSVVWMKPFSQSILNRVAKNNLALSS